MEDRILSIKITEDEYEIILMTISNEILRIKKELEIDKEMSKEEKDIKTNQILYLEKITNILKVCKRYNEE